MANTGRLQVIYDGKQVFADEDLIEINWRSTRDGDFALTAKFPRREPEISGPTGEVLDGLVIADKE